ncbi:MAG: [acyl-carrier-protein] S-malonyltransferase [Bdellovibrio sp. CG10_big_fil_rev_8_21_14_0_10_47_8]|nr:MAG: [acyl-carrier-protein] S-malonyltransferase [Bdellovibrio sp. CG10_big_fil_rev_8_21_14_0_10_47_8]
MANTGFHLIFPGQGSQHPGMGRFLFENFPIARQAFEEASDSVGLDLKKLCFDGSDSDLALTENTQPCLLTVSTATQRVLLSQLGLTPVVASGHSIGEYAALVAAQALPFSAAVRAVRTRGQAMQAAVPVGQGSMAAVMGLEPSEVEKMCAWTVQESRLGPLSPANFNSPGQIVISGKADAIQWLQENLKPEELFGTAKRVRLIPLQVSAPFHCEMMAPAEEKMREVLTEIPFQTAKFPIIQNYTAQLETKAELLRENLIRQVSAPVRWMQSMDLAKQKGYTTCIECGAGKVLQGLLKKIDSTAFRVFNTNSLEDIENIEKFAKELS